MILLYGLGNNEAKYLATKHNIGRVVVEELAKKYELSFTLKDGYYYTKSKSIACIYSAGYMNVSGNPLSHFLSYFKYTANNSTLILLQDDSDQAEGAIKLVVGGGSAGHRGVDDVYNRALSFGFKPEHIWRLKMGIRPVLNRQKSETFVLSNLSVVDEKIAHYLANQLFLHKKQLEQGEVAWLQNKLNGDILFKN